MKNSDRNPVEFLKTVSIRRWVNLTLRQAWRLVIGLVGATVVFIGIAMIFLPGPAFVVIPLGLAILAIEFVWARRLLRRIKVTTQWNARKLRSKKVAPLSVEKKSKDL